MASKFIQIHTLTPYAATLLNRDDAGFAKRLPFGGVYRTRISSQCLKRHWRTFEGEGSLDDLEVPGTIRSQRTFEHYIVRPLVEGGLSEGATRAVTEALIISVLGESPKAREKKKSSAEDKSDSEALHTSQVTVLGEPEVAYLKDLVASLAKDLTGEGDKLKNAGAERVKKAIDKDAKQNLQQMKMAAGLGAALFGRMVTSDVLARCDAAIHVAHAFTVHEQDSEDDYFSAIDDLKQELGEQGSGHINSAELTSGLYYGYVVVDVPLLVSNLTGCHRKDWLKEDRQLAGDIVSRLIWLISTVSPGAKLGSTAPYSRAHLVMVEAGDDQPRTLANAFFKPVRAQGDMLGSTYRQLSQHLAEMDAMYPWKGLRCFAALGPVDALRWGSERQPKIEHKENIDAVRAWASEQVVRGAV